jgi:hypothetical protein
MKDYFKGQTINTSNKYRKNIVVQLSNIILDKRDRLPRIGLDKISKNGKRGKYSIRVWNPTQVKVKCDVIVGYYDTSTSDSQVLEHINDNLPRILKDRWVVLQAGLDTEHFSKNKIHSIDI